MSKVSMDAPHVQLAAWRERGDDRLAPLRFYFIEALSRRVEKQGGDVRRLLNERLSRQLQAYQDDVVEREGRADQGQGEDQKRNTDKAASGPLAELLAYAASQTQSGIADHAAPNDALRKNAPNLDPELIDYFRLTWARVSANRLLRQSGEQVPDNAGPLNSSSLAHRSLLLMRELSPGYLQHFLSYIEALSWMEQLNEERTGVKGKAASATKRKLLRR